MHSKKCSSQASPGFTGYFSFHSGPSVREIPHGLPIPSCQSNTLVVIKKGMKWATTYSSLLFYFGFGYTNGVTPRSFLSRLPGVQFPQHLGSLAPSFLSGLQRCQCALTPISPLRWHLSLLRHTICSLSSL